MRGYHESYLAKRITILIFLCVTVLNTSLTCWYISNKQKAEKIISASCIQFQSENKETSVAKFVKEREEIQEAQEVQEVQEVQEPQKTWQEVFNDPNTKAVDLIPYLAGNYEENLASATSMAFAEMEGCSDIIQQYEVIIMANRTFYYGHVDLETVALAHKGDMYQYESIPNGRYYLTPDEQSRRNAEAVLNGNFIDMDAPKTLYYIGTVKQRGKPVYKEFQLESGKTVYIQYIR